MQNKTDVGLTSWAPPWANKNRSSLCCLQYQSSPASSCQYSVSCHLPSLLAQLYAIPYYSIMYPIRFTFCSLVWPLLVLATEIIAQDSSPNLQGTKNSAQSSLTALANLSAVTPPDSVSKDSMQVSKSSLASLTGQLAQEAQIH